MPVKRAVYKPSLLFFDLRPDLRNVTSLFTKLTLVWHHQTVCVCVCVLHGETTLLRINMQTVS
jgi:hypothetical protein